MHDTNKGSLAKVSAAEAQSAINKQTRETVKSQEMSKTKSATTSTRKSSHNYDDHEGDHHDELSDELSISSSEDDVVATRKSRKLQVSVSHDDVHMC